MKVGRFDHGGLTVRLNCQMHQMFFLLCFCLSYTVFVGLVLPELYQYVV